MRRLSITLLFFCVGFRTGVADDHTGQLTAVERQPNVLFIAIDDLNDWVGSLGGHPDVKTPNIDRLAARGVSFTNAHCQAPICMPSRTSLLTGTNPHRNGVYMIEQSFEDAPMLTDVVTLPRYFRDNGYRTVGCGKIYHRSSAHVEDWDDWGFRRGWNWMKERVGEEGVSGLPQPSIFDFGPLDAKDEEMNDWQVVDWIVPRLQQKYDKPFFIAAGLITPHLPLFTPEAYYRAYPLNTTRLPATLPGDLDDLPPMGRKFTRYFDSTPMSHHNITRHGLWHKAVASYLATATFTDKCVGRLLDALATSPHRDNTIIVLWSDHGFHVGEKMHWEKRSLWEESTRVPLMFLLPSDGLASDGSAGHGSAGDGQDRECPRPVGLIDIYPTLVELCGLPPLQQLQGRSLVPLLKNPQLQWDHPVLTTHHPGNHAVRSERWRYIRYANGDEELYDHDADPHEWKNLANDPQYAEVKQGLSEHVPKKNAPYAPRLPRQKFTQEFDWSTAGHKPQSPAER
jgi:arylsulfatase A-like enzyme